MKNLRSAVHGRVLSPGDDDFTDAARPWNLAVEQPVAAVVDAEDSDDIAALVRYARNHGLTVTAQPSGHGATGDVDGCWRRSATSPQAHRTSSPSGSTCCTSPARPR